MGKIQGTVLIQSLMRHGMQLSIGPNENLGEELPGISPSQPSSSFFCAQYLQPFRDLKKSRNISSYVHIEKSFCLLTLGIGSENPGYLEGIRDSQTPVDVRDVEGSSEIQNISETKGINQPQEPLCEMDLKVSKILAIRRKHFSCILDFRHMPGLKIQIPYALRAMYATILNFSSSSPYGSIPSLHISFLLGEPLKNNYTSASKNCLDIVPIENGPVEQEITLLFPNKPYVISNMQNIRKSQTSKPRYNNWWQLKTVAKKFQTTKGTLML
ncbi:hypothetical protein NE237_029302 [Protea cynaroides]|uniref:Uncharacterized protein n=1 Tax=Protea cynaroides TaxID=273540 RepID=A0A9Q0GS14_9MAGN|nr:hypothetical protein NE237_029302 [Protea cynaroides]